MALAMAVVGFAALFADFGLSSSYIHRQNITDAERSALWWAAVIVGALLSLVMCLGSWITAVWYGEEVAHLLLLMSPIYLIASFGQQYRAHEEKRLNFKPVVLIEISSSILGFAVAVSTAISSLGVYALAAGALVTAAANSLLNFSVLSHGWRPGRGFEARLLAEHSKFGSGLLLNNLVNYANQTMDLLVGGKSLAAASLGLYSLPRTLALQIQFVINPIVTRAAFPLIASNQANRERVGSIYIGCIAALSSINGPAYFFGLVFAHECVTVLWGGQWVEAAPLMRWLCLWGALRAVCNPLGSLLVGLGEIRRSTYWNCFWVVLNFLFILVGVRWGASGLAKAMAISSALAIPSAWFFLIKPLCPVRFFDYVRGFFIPWSLSAVSALIAYELVSSVQTASVRFLFGFAAMCIVYPLLTWTLNRREVARLAQLI